jgi:hypothetical protein
MATYSRTIHNVVVKKCTVVEDLHEGRSFCKVWCCVVEQTGGQAQEVRAKALPLGLKSKPDDRVEPAAGRMDSAENFVRGESGHSSRWGGFCGLFFGKHRSSVFPFPCCLRFAEASAQERCQQNEIAFFA